MFEVESITSYEQMVLEHIYLDRPAELPPLMRSVAAWLAALDLVIPPGQTWEVTAEGRRLLRRVRSAEELAT